MKNILVVGAGGIGSWLADQLYVLESHEQLINVSITFADDDTVDNTNLTYQNFELDDVLDYKTESIAARYGFEGMTERIDTQSSLDNYDCVVSAVDNTKFRKLLFNWANTNPDKHWIDLRSEGNSIAAFTKNPNNTLEKMLSTLGEEEVEDGSCQRSWELENNVIQNGNKIVAAIGAQYILNYVRNTISPPQMILTF
ncbi:ThiF family adenylyltransferase [bacterium]|nr:ThiF family adenylyltransferase [bacterium]